MTMLMKIEDEVKSLPQQEFEKFKDWFTNYEYQKWDELIENDTNAGKLDELASLAIADFKGEKFKTL